MSFTRFEQNRAPKLRHVNFFNDQSYYELNFSEARIHTSPYLLTEREKLDITPH